MTKMALQRVFKQGYIEYLKTHIKPSLYKGDHFEYDHSQALPLYGVTQPEGLAERVVPTRVGDFSTAVAIYEAYSEISPLFAQQDNLWVYLSHTELFDYLKRRWPILTKERDTEEKQVSFIFDHWFRSSHGIIRSALMGLWWAVHCSIDESREDKYELTRVLFIDYTFRTMVFGNTQLFRHREATLGILGFLHDNPNVFADNTYLRGQFIAKYFNQLGGVKQLASLDSSFFYNECEHILPHLLEIKEREQVQNIDVYAAINS